MNTAYGDHLTVALEGHVAVMTLDRPPHNFVSTRVVRDIADAFEAADADPQVRAIVLQAEGKTFSAGADFTAARSEPVPGKPHVSELYVETVRLYRALTPVVAAIQGAAVGAGLGVALVADFRVASPQARLSANFVTLGYYPGFGVTHVLPRLIGQQRAALMMLTGRRVKAEEALAWGLVDEVVPAEELRAAALRLASEIAANAPLAVAETRKMLRAALADEVEACTGGEYARQQWLRETEDFKEGVRAVAERRPGVFKGR